MPIGGPFFSSFRKFFFLFSPLDYSFGGPEARTSHLDVCRSPVSRPIKYFVEDWLPLLFVSFLPLVFVFLVLPWVRSSIEMEGLFQRKSGGLPVANSSGSDGWGSSSQKTRILPKAETATWATWAWFLISVMMIIMGIRYCTLSTNIRTLMCDGEACTFTIVSPKAAESRVTRFGRHELKSAQQVRLRRGQIRDTSGGRMSRKQMRKLGYSYSIKFVTDRPTGKAPQQPEEIEEVPMAVVSIGRRRPREMEKEINNYINCDGNKEDCKHELKVEETSGFDFRGLLFLVLGLMSMLFCALMGQFSDPPPVSRRKGRSARTRVTKKRAY